MRELLKDPDYREAQRTQLRLQLPQNYPDLARELGLAPAEADALFDLMASQQIKRMMLTAFNSDDSDEVRQQAQREAGDLVRTGQAEVANLLGPVKNQAWQEYQKTLVARQQVGRLRTTLSTAGYPLTDAQAAPLLVTITAEQQRRNEESSLRTYTQDPRRQLDFEEENVKAIETSNERILEAAQSYLNAQQMTALKSSLTQQSSMSRALTRARRAQLGSEVSSPTAIP